LTPEPLAFTYQELFGKVLTMCGKVCYKYSYA
jgi:hypothetical protein